MSSSSPRAGRRPQARTAHHAEFPAARLAAERAQTVSVCLPARDEAATIGPIVAELMGLVAAGAVDEVLVADHSVDDTAQRARAEGARVVAQADVLEEVGPVCGKGDALWRALAASTGELVCFLDADTIGPVAHFACGLLGPLVCAPGGVRFVKGAYRRPLRVGGTVLPEGGGRVTQLCARPLLRRLHPEVAWLAQPLAGEMAATRELLEQLPFTLGYGVDVALLLDAAALAGPAAIAQVDLDVRQNRHQPLDALGRMADEVCGAILRRAGVPAGEDPGERPPLAGFLGLLEPVA